MPGNMRSEETHLNISPKELLEILVCKLVPGKTYYHCMAKGIIYDNKIERDYFDPIIDVFRLTGKYDINIPKNPGLLITTGLSKEGLEYSLNKLDELTKK